MTLVAVNTGFIWPIREVSTGSLTNTNATMDAATEKVAHLGRLHIDGIPAGTKTLSTGTIKWACTSATFANGATTIDIGLQGVATGAGPIAQPDGTFTVKKTETGGSGIATGSVTTTMNSGTVSLSHGDLVAVVWDMTARGGADSVLVGCTSPSFDNAGTVGFPTTNAYVAGAWQTGTALGSNKIPNVLITFDDGTLGWISGSFPSVNYAASTTTVFKSADTPNEYGMLFQVPWDCEVDAIVGGIRVTDANSDYTLKLYSDPTGTPTLLTGGSVTCLGETFGTATLTGRVTAPFASRIALSKGTNYGVTVLATGSSNTGVLTSAIYTTGARVAYDNANMAKITRSGSSGAFTAESPALTIYHLGVRICSVHDTSSSGGFPVLEGPLT